MTTEPIRDPAPNLDDMLDRVRDRAWTGPDHNPKVDAFLSEQAMTKQRKAMSKSTIAIALAALVGGGVVTAAVTTQIMGQRAKIVTDDGTEYDVILSPTTEGAAGTFVTDDGQEFGIDFVAGDSENTVSVELSSDRDASATVTIPDYAEGGAMFIDEDGVRHDVSPEAAKNWTTDDAKESDG